MSWQAYIDTLPRLVRETGGKLLQGDFERALASAVLQYSHDAPRRLVRDVLWLADGYINEAVPDEMTEESVILGAEWPIGQVPPAKVLLTQYVTDGPLGLMSETALPGGATVRLTFSAAHELVGGTDPRDTIPAHHRDAVLHFAAHLLCRELATLFSGEIDSSIGADASNTESRARNYAARSKDYRAAYFAALGVSDPMTKGGSATGSGGSAATAAGAVTSWPARARPSWRTNDQGGAV